MKKLYFILRINYFWREKSQLSYFEVYLKRLIEKRLPNVLVFFFHKRGEKKMIKLISLTEALVKNFI